MAVAVSEPSHASLSELQPLWHSDAPRRLVERCPASEPLEHWSVWRKHVAHRKRPRRPAFLVGKQPPILWGWPAAWEEELGATGSASALLDIELLSTTAQTEAEPHALQSVALAYALPDLAERLTAEAWWQLAERLHRLAAGAQQQGALWPGDPRGVVRHQLLAGELPLTLGYLFPEIRALHSVGETARDVLSEALNELTDGRGLPHARLLPALAPLFACWTRVRWLGDHLKQGCWSAEAEGQYEWLVRHALRLVDTNGHFMLTGRDAEQAQPWPKGLFTTALELVGDKGDCAAAALALPKNIVSRRAKLGARDMPRPSFNSDWSALAVLADGWSRRDIRVALNYADDPLQIELAIGRSKLLLGDWTFETICDGTPVQMVGVWQNLCWESNRKCDLLELGCELTGGLRLERQVLFAREDRVLYLADILLSADGATHRMRHSLSLPIAPDAEWRPEAETRDGVLAAHQQQAAVLPLALSEWRTDPRGGSLAEDNGRLVLTQEAEGRAMCCPLVLDLVPRRAKRERTWRQLAVAESLETVPRDVAVGYRAQSGSDQWLVYRSLGRPGNRTLLGHNVAGEFVAGGFRSSGKLKEWIEIEPV